MNLSPTGSLFRTATPFIPEPHRKHPIGAARNPVKMTPAVPEYHPVTMCLEEEFKMDILALLKAERDKVARQLEGLNAAVAAFAGTYRGTGRSGGRRPLSTAARARIAAAQR